MNFIQRNLLSLFALAAMILFSIMVFDGLPDQLPSSYNLEGEVIDTQPKWFMVSLLPAIFVLIVLGTNGLIAISPEKFSMPNSKRAMDIILFGIGVMMFFIHVGTVQAEGDMQRFTYYFAYGMAAFLIITGNVFGKTERNFFIGIRLPWTLASTANWRATHRLAAKLMVIFGLVLLVSNVFYTNLLAVIILSVAPLLLPVVYSPYYYFKHEKGRVEPD